MVGNPQNRAEFKSHLVAAIKSEFKRQLAMNQKDISYID
jgi:hypothetical protein